MQFIVYLSSAPHSYAVFDSATAVSWRKLQKTTLPGALHGRCTHSKAVGTSNHNIPKHLAQLSKLGAQQTNNQQAYISVSSTGHIKAVNTINCIQTVESAITWHPDCRISSPCPT